jgi:nicotine blue oxidoreductase
MPTRVAGILLAAGGGSRLGRPKALVEFGGQTLAARGVDLLRTGGADPIVVVTGAVPVDLPGARIVPNPHWRTGMGSSLIAGLSAVRETPPGTCRAAVIALADQPLVGAASVRRLIAAHATGATVAVAAYAGRSRNPVLIDRTHWDEVLATTTGDAGARPFLRAHPELVVAVECADTGRPDDIDTPEDLTRAREAVRRKSGLLGFLPPCGRWCQLRRVGGERFTAATGLEPGWQAGRISDLAENEAAVAEADRAGDDERQGQRLTGQVPGPGPDVLCEQEHPEHPGPQRIEDGEPGL